MNLRQAAQQALNALEETGTCPKDWPLQYEKEEKAITALRTALAEPEQQPQRVHPLDMPLEVFVANLSTRPRNIINAEMMYFTHSGDEFMKPPFTVRHLMMFSRKELRAWPNLGKRSLNEIEEWLRNLGLQLWEKHDERSLKLLREHPTYYTAPTPRKPLTDEQMRECAQAMNAEPLAEGWPELIKFARAIERAHGIGEQT